MVTSAPNQFSKQDQDIYFPNDIRLIDVLVKVGNNIFDVKRLLIQINLYEDLYSNVLSGSITLADAVNLIGNAPFTGQEQLELTFKTPGFPSADEVNLTFDIYQVSDRNTGSNADLTDTVQTYTLYFVSQSYYQNKQLRIRQAFTKQPISEMVKKIGNAMGVDIAAEPTSGVQTYIIPGWNPFFAINWLANRARPSDNPHAANYFFYETVTGFKFISLNSLIRKRPEIRYVFDMANVRLTEGRASSLQSGRERLIVPECMIIRNYKIIKSGTTLDRIEQGMYASKLITHDLVRKQFSEHEFHYQQDFRRLPHIEDQRLDSRGSLIGQDAKPFPGISRHGGKTEAVVKFYPKHSFMFDDLPDYDESEKWVLQRTSQLRQLEQLRIRVELPGDSNRRVGDVVILDVPRPEFVKGFEPPSDRDPNISGNYLITNVHHIIEIDNHRMILELSKESLPPTSNQSIVDKLDLASTWFGSTLNKLGESLNSGKTLLRNIFK